MAFFKSLFGKKESAPAHRGFGSVKVRDIIRLTPDAVQVILDLHAKDHPFAPGQYLNFLIVLDGQEFRRSYSICSGPDEYLSVAVKVVGNGPVSHWFNEVLKPGDEILVSEPLGSFTLPEGARNVVAITAGSGITPILSMAKSIEQDDRNITLFYGNRTLEQIMFRDAIDQLSHTDCRYFLSAETVPDFGSGRIDKQAFTDIVKADFSLLRRDVYMLCGPEQMILEMAEVLEMFGVPKEKIRYELFTTPKLMKQPEPEASAFEGVAQVTVLLDGEKVSFKLPSDGKSILEASADAGLDVPFSCKGGVCSTCKGKVTKGKATMRMNYVLTDREVEAGYVLTCQARPASAELEVTYDV